MCYDFLLKSHNLNSIKLQHQVSFHVKKLKFYFEIHRQIFAQNVAQTIIWLKINYFLLFHTKISWLKSKGTKVCVSITSHEIPDLSMILGTVIIILTGIYTLYRERSINIKNN